jgi:hypothetical protein
MLFRDDGISAHDRLVQHGGTEKVESASSCVVYDALTGHIHHWHHSITLAGGRHPSDDEVAKDAVAAALRGSLKNQGDLRVLHVSLDAIEPDKRYSVDHQGQKLVVQDDKKS